MEKFRLLRADEIEVRIKQVAKFGAVALLYKTARTDMDMLDEVVGPENWRKEYREIKGNLYCTLYIRCGDEWVGKEDCGIESRDSGDGNEKKGEASDAFKRAGFCWGIGRELYTAPFICIDLPRKEDDWNGKKIWRLEKNAYLTVSEILYDAARRIAKLVIQNGNKPVYVFPSTAVPAFDAHVDTPEEAALRDEIIQIGVDKGGDRARAVAFAEKLFGNKIPFDNMNMNMLRTVKMKLEAVNAG